MISDNEMYYILLDEVQMVDEFEAVLNSLLHISNTDTYVTGSNARFLSKDVITEFRGRGDEVCVHPLSFREYHEARRLGDRFEALNEYMIYGGMPQVFSMTTAEQKKEYLKNLFTHTYISDIKERYSIKKDDELEVLMDFIASSTGTLTNPLKLKNTFKSVKNSNISVDTIKKYLNMMQDAFLINKAVRYDIKGKKYIDTPVKYYFEDLGLRNARINFRQTEQPHLLENLIYNELRIRGFSVDVGQVVLNTKNTDGISQRKQLEIDFVCNQGYKRCYIQSAYALPTLEKEDQELNSLRRVEDGFQRFVIVGMPTPRHQNDDGIMIMNVFDFLMDENSLIM